MSRPSVSDAANELYEAFATTFTGSDESLGWPLLLFCDALTKGPLSQIHGYVVDQPNGTPGWERLLDPDNAPAEVLPWLAQLDGAVLHPNMTEAQQRAAIKAPEGFRRGTLAALMQVAGRHLTGSKTVLVDERYTGDAWKLRVRTPLSETPDPAVTEAEIRAEQKPVGIVLTYLAYVTQDWGDLRADHATWALVRSGGAEPYATWFDARTDVPT